MINGLERLKSNVESSLLSRDPTRLLSKALVIDYLLLFINDTIYYR